MAAVKRKPKPKPKPELMPESALALEGFNSFSAEYLAKLRKEADSQK